MQFTTGFLNNGCILLEIKPSFLHKRVIFYNCVFDIFCTKVRSLFKRWILKASRPKVSRNVSNVGLQREIQSHVQRKTDTLLSGSFFIQLQNAIYNAAHTHTRSRKKEAKIVAFWYFFFRCFSIKSYPSLFRNSGSIVGSLAEFEAHQEENFLSQDRETPSTTVFKA